MKKIKNMYPNKLFVKIFVFLAFISLLLPGCGEDFLEKNPQANISEPTFWKTKSDANLALIGCYEKLGRSHNWTDGWNNGMVEGLALFSDIAQVKNPNAPGEFGVEMHSNSRHVGFMWDPNWEGISRHNYFLENIDKVDMDEDEKAEMIAEVRFLRAYRYFYLNQFFGGVPLITKTLTYDEANSVSRNPKEEVVEFILDELTAAAQNLPVSRPPGEYGRIEKGAALAMKGRLLMAEKRWSEAANTYKEVIDLGEYIIDPRYKELFEDGGNNSQEVILTLTISEELGGTKKPQNQMPTFYVGGNQHTAIFKNFVDEFLMNDGMTIDESPNYDPDNPYENRDPRLYATVFLPGYTTLPNGNTYYGHPDTLAKAGFKNRGLTGFSWRKGYDAGYEGPPSSYAPNLKLIRYAEVLLSYLESKLEAGDPITQELLEQTINKVRGREEVDMPPVTETDPDALREIVRRERLCELAFEQLRLWDLVRWGIATEKLTGQFLGMKLTDDPANYTGGYNVNEEGYLISVERRFEEHNNLWPIPQGDLDSNPNLEQNPGYD